MSYNKLTYSGVTTITATNPDTVYTITPPSAAYGKLISLDTFIYIDGSSQEGSTIARYISLYILDNSGNPTQLNLDTLVEFQLFNTGYGPWSYSETISGTDILLQVDASVGLGASNYIFTINLEY